MLALLRTWTTDEVYSDKIVNISDTYDFAAGDMQQELPFSLAPNQDVFEFSEDSEPLFSSSDYKIDLRASQGKLRLLEVMPVGAAMSGTVESYGVLQFGAMQIFCGTYPECWDMFQQESRPDRAQQVEWKLDTEKNAWESVGLKSSAR